MILAVDLYLSKIDPLCRLGCSVLPGQSYAILMKRQLFTIVVQSMNSVYAKLKMLSITVTRRLRTSRSYNYTLPK